MSFHGQLPRRKQRGVLCEYMCGVLTCSFLAVVWIMMREGGRDSVCVNVCAKGGGTSGVCGWW